MALKMHSNQSTVHRTCSFEYPASQCRGFVGNYLQKTSYSWVSSANKLVHSGVVQPTVVVLCVKLCAIGGSLFSGI